MLLLSSLPPHTKKPTNLTVEGVWAFPQCQEVIFRGGKCNGINSSNACYTRMREGRDKQKQERTRLLQDVFKTLSRFSREIFFQS